MGESDSPAQLRFGWEGISQEGSLDLRQPIAGGCAPEHHQQLLRGGQMQFSLCQRYVARFMGQQQPHVCCA